MAKEIDILKVIEELALELLKLTGSDAGVVVKKEEEVIVVNIDSEKERGLLIGNRGETLLSFQTILNLIVKNKTGEWKNIVVNIGDWRKKQEEYLEGLAQQAADRASETGRPQHLYNLNSSQRRIIHTYLTKNDLIETLSEGEGKERYLIIRSKKTDEASK